MFVISMPKTFAVGDTLPCKINLKAARVTWRDAETLVIEPSDARVIVEVTESNDLLNFVCGDAGDPVPDVEIIRPLPSGRKIVLKGEPAMKVDLSKTVVAANTSGLSDAAAKARLKKGVDFSYRTISLRVEAGLVQKARAVIEPMTPDERSAFRDRVIVALDAFVLKSNAGKGTVAEANNFCNDLVILHVLDDGRVSWFSSEEV